MTVTPIYAGLLAILFLILSINVIRIRRSEKISLGDGDNALLRRRIRAQGNFAEYVPIAIILLLALEAGGSGKIVLHGLGAALLISRLLHGFAFSFVTPRPLARQIGVLLTMIVIALSAVLCVTMAFGVVLRTG